MVFLGGNWVAYWAFHARSGVVGNSGFECKSSAVHTALNIPFLGPLALGSHLSQGLMAFLDCSSRYARIERILVEDVEAVVLGLTDFEVSVV